MALDLFKNFAKVTVSTGYDASATSVVLSGGHGAKLPTVPFNATWWNATDYSDPSDDPNVEIVRVTAIATDTLTVTRAQESTTATTKNTGGKTYKMIAGLTAKTFNTDLMSTVQPQVASGRLTLTAGEPLPVVGDIMTPFTTGSTIYYSPYGGNCLSLYDGSSWICHEFDELSLPLGTLVANTNYDVFAYDNAGTLTLELGSAWASDVLRANLIVRQDGIFVKAIDHTHRLLGTIRTISTTETEDSLTRRFVSNSDNRVIREIFRQDVTAHTYNGAYRQWNNNVLNQLEFVSSLPLNSVTVIIGGAHERQTNPYGALALGLDSTSTAYRNAEVYPPAGASGGDANLWLTATVEPLLGYHKLVGLQTTLSAGAGNFSSIRMFAQVFC